MQHTANEIIETIRTLPIQEKVKVYEWLDEEKREFIGKAAQRREKVENQIKRFKEAEKWLAENREKYLNEWVCLDGDKLIAHGKDALEVDRQAKEAGIEAPFLEHIVEEKYPFGGW